MRQKNVSGSVRSRRSFFAAITLVQICTLLRYTLLARVIGPEQLGLAVTLILVSQFFDSITDNGSERFLISNREGDAPELQKLAQILFVIKGIISASGLIATGLLLSYWQNSSKIFEGALLLAISPFILGFTHLDVKRLQRYHKFNPESFSIACGEIASLIVTVVASLLLRDFIAMVLGLVTRSIFYVSASHLMADRPYRLGLTRKYTRELLRYSLPLMLNGVLLFVASQSDRLIIGHYLGAAMLGVYSAATLLIYYPSQMFSRYLVSVQLPIIAEEKKSSESAGSASSRLGAVSSLLASVLVICYSSLGPHVIPILFGAAFATPALTVTLVAVLQSVRFLRLWPTAVAMAEGTTRTVLVGNVIRVLFLPLMSLAIMNGGTINDALFILIAGELCSLLFSSILVCRVPDSVMPRAAERYAVFSTICIVSIYASATLSMSFAIKVIAIFCIIVLSIFSLYRERNYWLIYFRKIAGRSSEFLRKKLRVSR